MTTAESLNALADRAEREEPNDLLNLFTTEPRYFVATDSRRPARHTSLRLPCAPPPFVPALRFPQMAPTQPQAKVRTPNHPVNRKA